MTTDHLALLAWINHLENPNWAFLSQNYPIGFLWDAGKISRLLGELSASKMIEYADAQSNVKITTSGFSAMQHYKEQAEQEAAIQKMTYEQLSLDLETLRNEVFDYDKTKNRSNWAFYISIGSLVLAVLTLIFKK